MVANRGTFFLRMAPSIGNGSRLVSREDTKTPRREERQDTDRSSVHDDRFPKRFDLPIRLAAKVFRLVKKPTGYPGRVRMWDWGSTASYFRGLA